MKLKFNSTLGLFFAGAVTLALSSCGSLGGGQFAQRKYTKGTFVHHAGAVTAEERAIAFSTPVPVGEEIKEGSSDLDEVAVVSTSSVPNQSMAVNSSDPERKDTKKTEKTTVKGTKKDTKEATGSGKKLNLNTNHAASAPVFKGEEISDTKGGDLIEVLLAIFIPPLGVWLHSGVDTDFWVSLILTLFLVTWLFASIFAVLVVLDIIDLG